MWQAVWKSMVLPVQSLQTNLAPAFLAATKEHRAARQLKQMDLLP
ncbi:MAG: hypothetical protein RSD03_01560 [Lachnospiraceae bacterium]